MSPCRGRSGRDRRSARSGRPVPDRPDAGPRRGLRWSNSVQATTSSTWYCIRCRPRFFQASSFGSDENHRSLSIGARQTSSRGPSTGIVPRRVSLPSAGSNSPGPTRIPCSSTVTGPRVPAAAGEASPTFTCAQPISCPAGAHRQSPARTARTVSHASPATGGMSGTGTATDSPGPAGGTVSDPDAFSTPCSSTDQTKSR